MNPGGLQIERDGAALRVSLSGAWTLPSVAPLLGPVGRVKTAGLRRAIIDSSKLERLDTAGAVLLRRLWRRLAEQGPASIGPMPGPSTGPFSSM